MIEYLLPPNRSLSNSASLKLVSLSNSASILVSLSKLKNHNSNPSLISQYSISLKSKNPKLKIFVWLQYLKTVHLFSVLNFFTFRWSPRPGSEGQLSLACDLFSPLSPKILFFLPISTHTPNVRTKSMIFSFSFSFSTLLPPYPQDPSPANTQLDFCWWVPFPSLFYGLWWPRFALLSVSRKNP